MKYIIQNGMKETEVEADSVAIIDDSGQKFELWFRKSDKEIRVSTSGSMTISPIASNVVEIRSSK